MQLSQVLTPNALPRQLQTAAKVALAVGGKVSIGEHGENLIVQFDDNDRYYFDPEGSTLHALEALGHAKTRGLMRWSGERFVRTALVFRIVFSNQDVRVQIGASRWYRDNHTNTPAAMRRALVAALSAYYDEAIAPYTAA